MKTKPILGLKSSGTIVNPK